MAQSDTLSLRWALFRELMMPDLSPVEIELAQQAYYAGASAALALVVMGLLNAKDPDGVRVLLVKLDEEIGSGQRLFLFHHHGPAMAKE